MEPKQDTPTPSLLRPAGVGDGTGSASDLRSLTLVAYVLFLLGGVTGGLTLFVGILIAYVKRRDATGTVWHGHFQNLITMFWVALSGVVLGLLSWPVALGLALATWPAFWPSLTLPLLLGATVFPALAIWFFYRAIRGLIRAGEERPY
jgi:uncharacterized membrane protein